jgi:hypothetical protein
VDARCASVAGDRLEEVGRGDSDMERIGPFYVDASLVTAKNLLMDHVVGTIHERASKEPHESRWSAPVQGRASPSETRMLLADEGLWVSHWEMSESLTLTLMPYESRQPLNLEEVVTDPFGPLPSAARKPNLVHLEVRPTRPDRVQIIVVYGDPKA